MLADDEKEGSNHDYACSMTQLLTRPNSCPPTDRQRFLCETAFRDSFCRAYLTLNNHQATIAAGLRVASLS